MLARHPSFVLIDDPLLVAGAFPEGIGSRGFFDHGGPAQEFAAEFNAERLHPHMPLSVPAITNNLGETYQQLKGRLPQDLAGREVDMASYFVECWSNLATFEKNGTDTFEARREFHAALAEQPPEIQAAVRSSSMLPGAVRSGAARSGARLAGRRS